MFVKKLIASVLSLGIIGACSMGALASTVSGSGMSSGGTYGAISINYSITTKIANTEDGIDSQVVSKMQFLCTDYTPTVYIDTAIFYNPFDPSDPLMESDYSGGTTSRLTSDPSYMQCILKEEYLNTTSFNKAVSTFHYYTPSHGSFTGGLTKYGFDA